MKNLKKVCALVLSLAMIVSTFTVSFAAEDTKTDAEVCEALGLIQGDGDGVTEEYLGTESPRWKIAIMSLRLRGKYEEALAFEGTETFADAEDMTWVAGRAILAYLKANPDCGWQGDDKNQFDPNGMMTVQQYYKVMLETLGYKQGTDFEWAEVMEFAAGKDLVVAADAEKLTMNDVAAVTVETLKAETSEGKTLTDVLVEAEVIDADSATDLLDYVAPVTAKMEEARAIDATTLTVTYDEAVSVDADDFIVKDGENEIAVSEVTSANGGKVAVLTVEELKVGEKYTVSNGEVTKTVVPTIKDDKTKPEINKAEAITGAVVTVEFETTNINQDTLVAENFSINNDGSVLTAEIDKDAMAEEKNVGKTIVVLGVSGLKAGKAYTLTTNNVTSFEGAVADESKATFAGKDADTKAPKVVSAKSIAGYQVEVVFEEAVVLDEEIATDISNYSISPELEIKDAKIKKNVIGTKDKDENVVILTTGFQKASTAYTLTVKNISDGTNVMKESEKVVFAGIKKVDNQVAESAKAINANRVEVTLAYEANETALDVANYSINNDIEVTAAEFKDEKVKKVVVLTTTDMKAKVAYTLTVGTGVQDILNQGLKEAKKLVFAGKDVDNSFSTSITAKAEDKNTVKITFGEEVDLATAKDLANYRISDLGFPNTISLDKDAQIATLKVATQTAGKSYTITMNNIKDVAGNVISNDYKVTFTGKGDTVTDIRVLSAEAVSKDMIKVKFNQVLKSDVPVSVKLTYQNGDSITGMTSSMTGTVSAKSDQVIISLDKDITAASVYKVTVESTPKGYYTNHSLNTSKNTTTFVGSDSDEAVFKIEKVEALDKTHVKVTFDSPLDNTVGDIDEGVLRLYTDANAEDEYKVDTVAVKNVNSVKAADSNKSLIFELNKEMGNSTVYYLRLNRVCDTDPATDVNFKTAEGLVLEVESNKSYKIASVVTAELKSAEDTKLAVESVVMYDKNTLEVKFNADVNTSTTAISKTAASGTKLDPSDIMLVNASSDSSKIANTNITKIVPVDSRTLRVYFTGTDKLTANDSGIYFVKFKDHATYTEFKTVVGGQYFGSDKDYHSFAKNAEDNDKVKVNMVEPITDNKIKVTLSEKAFKDLAEAQLDETNFIIRDVEANVDLTGADLNVVVIDEGANAYKEYYIETLNATLLSGKSYRVGLTVEAPATEVVDESGLATDLYNTSNETEKSMEFGGIASAIVAPTSTQLAQWSFDYTADPKTVVLTSDSDAVIADNVYKLEVYVGTSETPTVEYYKVLVDADRDVDSIIQLNTNTAVVGGDKIFYRFTDKFGTSSAWVQGGIVVKEITADKAISDVAVALNDGTSLDSIKSDLGNTVILLAGTEEVTVPVEWATDTTVSYDNSSAATYELKGTIGTLPTGYADDTATIIEVIVNIVVS